MDISKNEMSMEEAVATEKSLTHAVESVLGQRCPMTIRIETYGRNDSKRLVAESEPLGLDGPFKLMFKELRVNSFGSMWYNATCEPDHPIAAFDLHFSYEHQSGGSNGCGAGFLGRRIHMELRIVRQWESIVGEWSAKLL